MRITHVIDSLEPSRGGPPVVASRLAVAQASLGHDVSIVSYCPPEQRETIAAFYEHIPGRSRVNFKFLNPDWNRVAYLVHDSTISEAVGGSDFLHLHGVWEPLLVEAANFGRQNGVGYAVRPAGMLDPWSLKQKMLKKRLAMMLGCRGMLDHAAFVHALNRDERYLLEPLGLKCPTRIIPNGIFLEEVEPLPERGEFRKRFPELGEKPFILFLSRLHYKKGLDFLADAFAQVARAREDMRLVVAGPDGGALEPFRRQIEQLRLTDRVVVVGPQYGREKLAAMVDAACFCLPSRQEGFSVAITEALACGTPVVISNACHFPEVDEFKAGLITALQPSSIAGALLNVLNDGELAATMGQNGREMVLSRYTWPTIARQTIDAYETSMARMRPRRGFAVAARRDSRRRVDRLMEGIRVAWDRLRGAPQAATVLGDDRIATEAMHVEREVEPPRPASGSLSVEELCQTEWWQEFSRIGQQLSPVFAEELRRLITDYLAVAPVAGDLRQVGPRRVSEIGYHLDVHQNWIVQHPKYAANAFAQVFLDQGSIDARRDVMAALAFLAAGGHNAAHRIIRFWDEIGTASYGQRGTAGDGLRFPSVVLDVAIISDSPSPTQFPLLDRLGKEMRECKIHNIFTHRISDQSMPWDVGIPAAYNPVFFPSQHLRFVGPVEKRSAALFRKIRRYLVENQVGAIILQGSDNLTRVLLVRWARRNGIPVFIAGDRSVFSRVDDGLLDDVMRGAYHRWLLRNASALFPMGTAGRAYFRRLSNHSLPEFLFPHEPDFSRFKAVERREVELFFAKHGLDPSRKRFLFMGPLDESSRVDLLLDAFAAFAARNREWDLLIAGDGPLRRSLESRVDAALASRLRFVGFVAVEQKAACFGACNVLIDPCPEQPWSMEIIEAVACGLAVIATSVNGSAIEVVRHQVSGLLVPPHNLRFLTEAMDRIATDGAYARMQAASVESLRIWRRGADPVLGLRTALNHFDLLAGSSRVAERETELGVGEATGVAVARS